MRPMISLVNQKSEKKIISPPLRLTKKKIWAYLATLLLCFFYLPNGGTKLMGLFVFDINFKSCRVQFETMLQDY